MVCQSSPFYIALKNDLKFSHGIWRHWGTKLKMNITFRLISQQLHGLSTWNLHQLSTTIREVGLVPIYSQTRDQRVFCRPVCKLSQNLISGLVACVWTLNLQAYDLWNRLKVFLCQSDMVYSTDRPAVIYRPVCKIHACHVAEILLVPVYFSYVGTLLA